MSGLKRVFGALDRRYMIRAYILGTFFLVLSLALSFEGLKEIHGVAGIATAFGYFGLCTVLFPFAKLVWDELKAMVLGDTVLFLPVFFLYPAKLFVNLFLWGFAVFVAPFGMAYIWFRTREA